jgi:hypothetical protein
MSNDDDTYYPELTDPDAIPAHIFRALLHHSARCVAASESSCALLAPSTVVALSLPVAGPPAPLPPDSLVEYNHYVGVIAPNQRSLAQFALAEDTVRRPVWQGRVVSREAHAVLTAFAERERARRRAYGGTGEEPPCPECCIFIFAMGDSEVLSRARAKVCDHVGRRRAGGQLPRPPTPDGFWSQRENDVPGSSVEEG